MQIAISTLLQDNLTLHEIKVFKINANLMRNDSKIKKMCNIGRDGNKISQINKIC